MTHPAQDALASLAEYLNQRADAEYRTNGSINPNEEMRLLNMLRVDIAPALQSASREWRDISEYDKVALPTVLIPYKDEVVCASMSEDGNWYPSFSYRCLPHPKIFKLLDAPPKQGA